MLDQEKAYDRIHHQYLRIMQTIQLLNKCVSIVNLFGFTKVHLSITGHICAPFVLERGHHQEGRTFFVIVRHCH
jgi:hypothetical protein